MDKECRRACAGQGRSDFSSDVPAFTHAGHDDSAAGVEDFPTSRGKLAVQLLSKLLDSSVLQRNSSLRRFDKERVRMAVHGRFRLMRDDVMAAKKANRNKRHTALVA